MTRISKKIFQKKMGAEPRKVLPHIYIMSVDEYPVCFHAFDLRNLVMAIIYIPRVQLKKYH